MNTIFARTETRVIAFAGADATDRGLLRYGCRAVAASLNMIFLRSTSETIAYLNGDDGFARRTRYPLPDVLVLDLKKPRVNAWEVIEWLKPRNHLSHIQLCFIGDEDDHAAISKAKTDGRCFFTTPADAVSYVNLVEALAHPESH